MAKHVGIITHYDVHNHGALLQLTALIRVLANKGIQAEALKFDKNYDFLGHSLKSKYEVSLKSVGHYVKFLKDRGFGSLIYNYRKHRCLNEYRNSQNLIGEYYCDAKDIDAVIIGSDEVFALHTGPTPVFFGHGLPTDKVVSYAGSFGPTTTESIDSLNCRAFVSSGLASMKGITVRDANSAKVIRDLTGKDATIVVDPVLLYGFIHEIEQLQRPTNEKYLLVYAYDNRMNNAEEVDYIKSYARKKGLKIVSPGFYHAWVDKNINVDPINLLAWFKFAYEVITDTFHGSVMSIITESKFITKTRRENHLKLSNLLNEYQLSNRILTDWNNIEAIITPEIDYTTVNKEVTRRREESLQELNNLLAACNL